MATQETTISDLTSASSVNNTDVFLIEDAVNTKKVSAETLANYVKSKHIVTFDDIAGGSVLSVDKGGTGNSDGYIRTGKKANTTIGRNTTIEGYDNTASGNYCHAEGNNTIASGIISHSEGYETTASGDYCHAEGKNSVASGECSHAEGCSTVASGEYSHSEGRGTRATGDFSHAEGAQVNNTYVIASGNSSHAEGLGTTASGDSSHAEGEESVASGSYSHAEGWECVASGTASHAEGAFTKATAQPSHSEGQRTASISLGAHAEGFAGVAFDPDSDDIDDYNNKKWIVAAEYGAHAEGYASGNSIIAKGKGSHAEGVGTCALSIGAHSEGMNTTAAGAASHAGGFNSTAGDYAFIHGYNSTASGSSSAAFGSNTDATGDYSFTANNLNTASGESSTAFGSTNTASGDNQLVCGKKNNPNTERLFIIGAAGSSKSNVFSVSQTAVYGTGTYNTSGADYAEMFEWVDGNVNNEDRRGKFVTLDGSKIKLATSVDDYILGVISGNPSVCGDVNDDQWGEIYLKDIFGKTIMEEVERKEERDDQGKIVTSAKNIIQQKLNPDYDPTREYIPRSDRPEWSPVGLLGKLVCIDDGTAQVNSYVTVNDDSIATAASERTKYRVMERLDENHIRIMIL